MLKSDIAALLADKFPNLPVKMLNDCVSQIVNVMGDALVNDQRIEIRDFGCFEPVHRTERGARNPKTGERCQMSARAHIRYKPGKKLKNLKKVGKAA